MLFCYFSHACFAYDRHLKNVDYASSLDDVSHGKEYSNSTACRVRDFASSMLKASDIRLHLTSPSSTYTLL